MRAGWLISLIGHIGIILMTLRLWSTAPPPEFVPVNVVPVEVVDVAPESNVRALSPPPEDDVSPESAPETQEDPAPQPTPTAAAEPAPERPRNRFDLNAVARMADKQREPGRERVTGAASDRTQQGVGLGTAEVASMQDRVRALTRAHMRRCFRSFDDLPDPDRLVVTIQWELDRNGNLRGQPSVTSPRNYTFDPVMRTAVDRALTAVRMCEPYPYADDPVVGEHFEIWRNGTFTFRASSS